MVGHLLEFKETTGENVAVMNFFSDLCVNLFESIYVFSVEYYFFRIVSNHVYCKGFLLLNTKTVIRTYLLMDR